jgi:hypothetical protein
MFAVIGRPAATVPPRAPLNAEQHLGFFRAMVH